MPPRTDRHPRAGQRRRRHPGAGGQGSDRHQGRAAHHVHHDSVALPGLHAAGHGVGVSARIEDEAERQRLREAVQSFVAPRRSRRLHRAHRRRRRSRRGAARRHAVPAAALGRARTRRRAARAPGNAGPRGPAAAAARCARPGRRAASTRCRSITTRHLRAHARVRRARSCRHSAQRIELYAGSRPIFDLYGVEDEIQRALERKVPLKSGGYLVIDQTEAMTTIDVNTGAFVGQRNLEETIYRTNLEAARRDRAPAAAAQPRRHHHHRLHRHGRGGAPPPGAAGAGEGAGRATTPRPTSRRSRRWAWSR